MAADGISRRHSSDSWSEDQVHFIFREGVMSTQTDVIIIGAGAAGLSAAKELTKQAISFIVVEASHRIGGRAYSEFVQQPIFHWTRCL